MAARKKNAARANGPHSAPHTPPSSRPAPSPAPPPDGPATAVWTALTASPGATADQIATAAGTSRAIAGRELASLETSGLATRTPRARNGRTSSPATWQPTPQAASLAPGTPPADQAPPASPGGAASPAPAAGDGDLPTPSGDTPDQGGGSTPGQDATTDAGAGETAFAPADTGAPSSVDGDTAPEAGIPDGPAVGPGAGTAPAPAGGEPQTTPAGEAAVLLRELASAATQAAGVADGADTGAALAAVDAICATAAQGRRLLKAAASGRRPRGTSPAARPGQLRDHVHAHLTAHPGAGFTPHQIGRVLGRSSGAVANALDRLTAFGQAELTSEKPRRYQATPATVAAAGTT